MDEIFKELVEKSEENARQAIKLVNELKPCVTMWPLKKFEKSPYRLYIFCMKNDRNQKVAIDLCKKGPCQFLEIGDEIRCHCPTSLQYLSGLQKVSKEELTHIKKERKAGRKLDQTEEEDN